MTGTLDDAALLIEGALDERPIVVPPDKLMAAGIQLPPGLVQKSCGLSTADVDALPAYVPVDTFRVSVEGGVIRLEVD